ncbi:MAG TPA: BlaI/MecI/CopY family transcriptional regulator [Bryobacteraceae bacterium]|jgi:BlaI family penicillinase repressor|nr:BlaI/MecI/CopY family transcriptional regulator [Bryobacteraceae bacterium]
MRRPAAQRDMPPPLELECLKALWGMGEGTVRDVRDVMVGNRNLAYTTVMTVLDRLEKRGGVSRKKQGRSFVYVPKLSREELRRFAVKEVVDRFFDGSTEALARFLRGQGPAARGQDSDMDASLL